MMNKTVLEKKVEPDVLLSFAVSLGTISGMFNRCVESRRPIFDEIEERLKLRGVSQPKTYGDCLIIIEETCKNILSKIESARASNN